LRSEPKPLAGYPDPFLTLDGARQTIVCSYLLDLGSETELGMHVKQRLFDDAYLSKVIDDMKSWFARMEVLHLIYQLFFFSANSLGRQPTTSQFFQPLSRQMIVLVAAAIHCALSEQATGEKVTGMFSQDEYQGKFYPPMVINCITAEAIALINCTWWGCFILPAQGAHPVYHALLNLVGAS
jgi:hypothetical protein